ncbi:hypothetical protein B0H14DRAFT_2558719 [Mycena olivaceomarginata]|nr:hypothetical protein B0H14DRAFT_2558719 [Mycena olivaceomarginata]
MASPISPSNAPTPVGTVLNAGTHTAGKSHGRGFTAYVRHLPWHLPWRCIRSISPASSAAVPQCRDNVRCTVATMSGEMNIFIYYNKYSTRQSNNRTKGISSEKWQMPCGVGVHGTISDSHIERGFGAYRTVGITTPTGVPSSSVSGPSAPNRAQPELPFGAIVGIILGIVAIARAFGWILLRENRSTRSSRRHRVDTKDGGLRVKA